METSNVTERSHDINTKNAQCKRIQCKQTEIGFSLGEVKKEVEIIKRRQ
jgi:hypothetical protein